MATMLVTPFFCTQDTYWCKVRAGTILTWPFIGIWYGLGDLFDKQLKDVGEHCEANGSDKDCDRPRRGLDVC
jgi:hypothetical protein